MMLHSMPRLAVRAAAMALLMAGSAGASGLTGDWWRQATANERLGYSYGMVDCAGGTAHLSFGQSYQAYADRLTAHYAAAAPQNNAAPLATAFIAMAGPRRGNAVAEPAATGHDTSSDGLLWLQIGLRPGMQRGYIEGALGCDAQLHLTGARFTKTAQEYVDQINRWYGQVPGSDQVNAARENATILSVLHRYRDGVHTSASVALPATR